MSWNPEAIDKMCEDLGYKLTSESVHVAADMNVTSEISAMGMNNPETDKDKIIEFFAQNGMGVISLDIHYNRSFVQHRIIGSHGSVPVTTEEEVSLNFTCYTDTIPKDAKTLKPYERSEIPEPESETFDLRGAL